MWVCEMHVQLEWWQVEQKRGTWIHMEAFGALNTSRKYSILTYVDLKGKIHAIKNIPKCYLFKYLSFILTGLDWRAQVSFKHRDYVQNEKEAAKIALTGICVVLLPMQVNLLIRLILYIFLHLPLNNNTHFVNEILSKLIFSYGNILVIV